MPSTADRLHQLERRLGVPREVALEVLKREMAEHVAATAGDASASPEDETVADRPQPMDRRWQDLATELDDEPEPALTSTERGQVALRRLSLLIEESRPRWQADALCLEYPGVSFFPERGESLDPAKEVCGRCACRQECRAWAIATDASAGVWAGESARALRQQLRADAA